MYLKLYPSDIAFKDNLHAIRDSRRKNGRYSEMDFDIRFHKNQNRSAKHVVVRETHIMCDGFTFPLEDVAEVTYYLSQS